MERNLTLLTDLYQLTMMQGYFKSDNANRLATFDLFYRKNPDGAVYSIAAGLDQAIEYINNLQITDEDIEYLKTLNLFTDDFLVYLKGFKFTGTIYAIPEGTVVFPNEPLMRITAPMIEVQFLETTLLNIINHQSLIATKAARVCWAAEGDPILEFGLRRAQGPDAGIYGARAAIIAGCAATSNVKAGRMFGVPIKGTHAHSWVMSFPTELEAFRTYAFTFPYNSILLVDTYDTLKSGVPNAITVFKELTAQYPDAKIGIRLDSGDLAYLSKEARKMLDEAGFPQAIISASNDLEEYLIRDLKSQGAKITLWGVGTNMITSKQTPAFGGVYKLAAEENEAGEMEPRIKLSENVEKTTNPGIKNVIRILDKETGKIKLDLIVLDGETIDTSKDLVVMDETHHWKRRTIKAGTFTVQNLLIPIYVDGKLVYDSPKVMDIRTYCQKQLNTLWPESRRFSNPEPIIVDISDKLYDLKKKLIYEHRGV